MKSESNRRFSLARMTVLARTLVRARVARFLADQPTFCQMDSVRVGQNVVGWRSVEWEGENQAQVGSFFHGDITVGRRTRFGTYSYVTGDVAVGRYGSFGSQVALIRTIVTPSRRRRCTCRVHFLGRREPGTRDGGARGAFGSATTSGSATVRRCSAR